MSQNERPSRESIWTVARGWVSTYFTVFTVLNTMNIARVVWFETTQASHAGWSQTIDAVVGGIGMGALAAAGLTISLTDIGRFTVVLASMFEDWVKRRRERQMAEAIEAAVGEAVTAAVDKAVTETARETARETATEVDALWRAWNARRSDAIAKGEPFDEPPPDVSGVSQNGR